MEHVHGIDVSWMTHGAPKDKTNRSTPRRSSVSSLPHDPPPHSQTPPSTNGNGSAHLQVPPSSGPKTPSPSRPGFVRGNSEGSQISQAGQSSQNGGNPQRRGSWLQNISSRFSSSAASPQPQPPPQPDPNAAPANPTVPKITPAKNAVLQHAAKHEGDGPYTPAPPKAQGSFLQVFRRFSGANGSTQTLNVKGNHGLVDRVTLNVDQHRERCAIHELNQSKLRRVAFCVDVEIAPMPKYPDPTTHVKTQRRKEPEKDEAESLKNPEAASEENEKDGVIQTAGDSEPRELKVEDADAPAPQKEGPETLTPPMEASAKKKEKKKRSEEERKARKEKKRQQAEANGSIPMEIHRSSTDSESSSVLAAGGPPKTHAFPTTNPVRIYRRCCQLRESPILKKITEQLMSPANSTEAGLVERLDLTGYYMDLPDLITLGDYFAVVPVREVILEGCGLTDEGLRVVLAGLLAAKRQEGRRRQLSTIDGLTPQGGVVERLVLKNNKIGLEGWKHISLFIYMCRSLKCLDLSGIKFPRPIQRPSGPLSTPESSTNAPPDIATLFSKAIGERLAGPDLELLNLGETVLGCDQLGVIIDGIIACGIRRLGLANNEIDADGLEHVARYLREGKCEGLDLGGNDLREKLDVIGNALTDHHPLWALSLADCNLNPPSLCKLFPKLAKLQTFRFIDLSHNRDLFNSDPNAVGILRRYLPKMAHLKRIHLVDVALSSEQTIALVEILPEVPKLNHINLLENPRLVSLANANTEESQEEACALYASLLAATRVSDTIVCVDIDVPSESSGEIVKALAKQVVAYCLRNMEKIQVPELGATMSSITEPDEQLQSSSPPQPYPDVLLNLVGHEIGAPDAEDKAEVAPDEDYVIGGTGVVKALACCLKNRGDESRRQSGEFIREVETGHITPGPKLPPGKAKDMSKHLLSSARRIRARLQPALDKSKRNKEDRQNYQRLIFLAKTLDGIIKRFEDEYPDTREPPSPPLSSSTATLSKQDSVTETLPSTAADEASTILSDADDDGLGTNIKPRSRSNSILSHTAKSLAEEEGRALRVGHNLRRGFLKQEHWGVLSSLEELGSDPRHVNILDDMMAELDDEYLKQRIAEIGVVETFKTEKERVFKLLHEADPVYWTRFIEAQEKARVNVQPGQTPAAKMGGVVVDENAVED